MSLDKQHGESGLGLPSLHNGEYQEQQQGGRSHPKRKHPVAAHVALLNETPKLENRICIIEKCNAWNTEFNRRPAV